MLYLPILDSELCLFKVYNQIQWARLIHFKSFSSIAIKADLHLSTRIPADLNLSHPHLNYFWLIQNPKPHFVTVSNYISKTDWSSLVRMNIIQSKPYWFNSKSCQGSLWGLTFWMANYNPSKRSEWPMYVFYNILLFYLLR